jgi:hypothetical protein
MEQLAIRQRRLYFGDQGPWEGLSRTARDRCQLLLSQLLQEVLEAERKEERDD